MLNCHSKHAYNHMPLKTCKQSYANNHMPLKTCIQSHDTQNMHTITNHVNYHMPLKTCLYESYQDVHSYKLFNAITCHFKHAHSHMPHKTSKWLNITQNTILQITQNMHKGCCKQKPEK